MSENIRVAVIDDHPLFRDGVTNLIEATETLTEDASRFHSG